MRRLRSFKLKRAGVELIIFTALSDKILMASALDYASVVKHHYDVRVAYG